MLSRNETTVFADVHRPALADALACNDDVTMDVIPGVNHLFVTAESGELRQWGMLDPEVPSRVAARIVKWIDAKAS